jgi:NAD(P)-dependent dehydrogenase (short-subunit alcohol dehydrogenase family)
METRKSKQTVIVTGAGSGIGYAIAEQFVEHDANVLLVGRTEVKLARAAEQLNAPLQVAIFAGDISLPATAERVFNAAREKFGRLDVLVNNAAIFKPNRLPITRSASWISISVICAALSR